ncbi:MAG: hypothetical protein HC851_09930 [Acaryochloris sp. RU_4_1]|nr:hypothetical protein [Acaryochloris sp. RU_4_1]NJN37680.1 hypothetical protein [Acaryochloridaceae cyanobacterium CSU_3_4]NJR55542.1 hypothetical protein [Acaryochloris sp. CRU_2_0]
MSRRQFSQRLRRLWEWADDPETDLPKVVWDKLLKLKAKAPQFTIAFALPEAARTSNHVDRLMNYQDRLLYAMQYLSWHLGNHPTSPANDGNVVEFSSLHA